LKTTFSTLNDLGFLTYVNFNGKSAGSGTISASASNSVQIYAKWPTYGQKCDFQYGGRRHLGFCGISILLVKPVVVLGPHFLSLCQIWCKSVRKWPSNCRLPDFKMAAAAILNLLPVTIFLSFGPLQVVAVDVSVKFHNCNANVQYIRLTY